MNYVGIDPSLVSTAVTINGEIFNYCKESSVYNKSGLNKWYKQAEPYIHYRFIDEQKFNNYSENEVRKLLNYAHTTDMIIEDIKNNILPSEETIIGIEGYSFGSIGSAKLDLVAFSTILRYKLTLLYNIKIISPSTLKKETCRLVYGQTQEGKKTVIKNHEGTAGGKLTKTDMFKAICDYGQGKFATHCISVKTEILENKNIPKPHEDSIDSYFISECIKKSLL